MKSSTSVIAAGSTLMPMCRSSTYEMTVAFNAHPVVRRAADTSVSVPFLDAVLFLLGISRDDVETIPVS